MIDILAKTCLIVLSNKSCNVCNCNVMQYSKYFLLLHKMISLIFDDLERTNGVVCLPVDCNGSAA